MDLTPQELSALRTFLVRAISDCHDVLAGAARRAVVERETRQREVSRFPARTAPDTTSSTPPAPKPKLMYGIKEAAGLLSISRSTIYAAIKAGDIKVVRIGGRTLIEADEIRTIVERGRGPRTR